MWVTPAWWARSKTWTRSRSNRWSHRWQWVSITGLSPASRRSSQLDAREQALHLTHRSPGELPVAEGRLGRVTAGVPRGARETEQGPQLLALARDHRPRPDRD